MKNINGYQCEACGAVFNDETECKEHEKYCLLKSKTFVIFKITLRLNLNTFEVSFDKIQINDAKCYDVEQRIFSIINDASSDLCSEKIKLEEVTQSYENESVCFSMYSEKDIDFEPYLKMFLKTFLLKTQDNITNIIGTL